MNESSTATRASIQIRTRVGTLIVDGFMLPDGSYRMSLTQSSGAVGFGPQNVSDFLSLSAVKSLLGQRYAVNHSQIELPSSTNTLSFRCFRAMSLEAVNAYWQWQAAKGNRDALALCLALKSTTLSCRFDTAFGVEHSELDYN
ncbi:MAG: hypothetical protein AAGE59_31375 [Cyanobacteria bacterium P01_F01_bin.86]